MNAIVYCRVSSKDQVDGTSLESQEAACRDYAQSKQIEVLKVFVEEGESAKFADRTRLLELIEFCRSHKGEVNILIVWKVDRFARNVTDHFSIKATLAKFGVRIASVTEPIDTNPEGKLMETILAGFAQFDNDLRAMRTVQGMRRKIQDGIFPWGPPLGYKSSVVGHEKKNLPDVPDEPSFSLVKRAFMLFARGAHTQAEMGRLMASWGLCSAIGKPLGPQTLYQIFTNTFYAGILIDPWTQEEFIGKHVPLVTRQTFERVQSAIARRNRSVAHTEHRETFPLRGLIRCKACGHTLTGAFSAGRSRRYGYYFCQNKECDERRKSLPVSAAHEGFLSFLDAIAPRSGLTTKIKESILRLAEQDQQERAGQRDRQKKRIGQLTEEIAELIRMRAQNLITDEEFIPQKRRLEEQRTALECNARTKLDLAAVRADLEKILGPLTKLRETWLALQPGLRARFDHLMLPAGFVNGSDRTADLGLLFSVFGRFLSPSSSGVPSGCIRPNPIFSEIHAFAEVLDGIEEPKPEPKRRFDNSHRKRLQMQKPNQ
jgi:site-specific DNA recombinase